MFDTVAHSEWWQLDIERFRSFRHFKWFEIVNYECCDGCESYPPFVPFTDEPPYPVPGCTREDGCRCRLSVVVTWWEEDDQAALLIAAQERSERKSDFKKREAERAAKDAIVNLFYAAAEEMKHWYGLRDSEPYALNKAIAAARNQVTLNQSFIDQRRKDYGEDLRLPRHYGFERLAILAEQEHRFDDGIALCEQAESEGWPGDWQKRIDRMSVKKRKTS